MRRIAAKRKNVKLYYMNLSIVFYHILISGVKSAATSEEK